MCRSERSLLSNLAAAVLIFIYAAAQAPALAAQVENQPAAPDRPPVQAKSSAPSASAETPRQDQSPLNTASVSRWLRVRGPRLLIVLLAIVIVRLFAARVTNRLARVIMRGAPGTAQERQNRANTLAGAFRYAVSAGVLIGGTLMLFEAAGMDIKTLLGGAAVLGLAVAFGAQSLIKDYFCGFIILLENQYSVNDVVKIGEYGGLVEQITLRMTALRDMDGSLHFIPNGNISAVTNLTHTWSRAVFDIAVSYKEDVDKVIQILKDLSAQLRQDPAFREAIVEDAEMFGVDQLSETAVVIKFAIKTQPLRQWVVKREMLRRIKQRFVELQIEMPYPRPIVIKRMDDLSQSERMDDLSQRGREKNH